MTINNVYDCGTFKKRPSGQRIPLISRFPTYFDDVNGWFGTEQKNVKIDNYHNFVMIKSYLSLT